MSTVSVCPGGLPHIPCLGVRVSRRGWPHILCPCVWGRRHPPVLLYPGHLVGAGGSLCSWGPTSVCPCGWHVSIGQGCAHPPMGTDTCPFCVSGRHGRGASGHWHWRPGPGVSWWTQHPGGGACDQRCSSSHCRTRTLPGPLTALPGTATALPPPPPACAVLVSPAPCSAWPRPHFA